MKKFKKTTSGKKGGLFVGKSHANGGIPAVVVDTGQPIEVEGGEVIINKEASKKYWKELSKINQSAGNGVPIPPPMEFSKDVSAYKKGGKITMSAIRQGTEMEMEHAKTIEAFKAKGVETKTIARKIAQDHLKENPNYYKILTKLKLAKGGEVICRSCGESWLTESKVTTCVSCGSDNSKYYKTGGKTENLSLPQKEQIYEQWKDLVNMSKSELKTFYNSEEGKKAGLTKQKADELGIDNGRTSALWIMKMKDIPFVSWTDEMWYWAKKQINFIKRMKGNKGSLYDNEGKKTRKHTSLLIWGHNPEKFNLGGNVTEFHIGSDYSGKEVRQIVSNYDSQEGTDMKEFSIENIKLKEKYLLDFVSIKRLLENDSSLHSYISDEYDPNIEVEFQPIENPILLGNDLWDNTENVVRDGYHRVLQALYNNEDKILAFIPLSSKTEVRFKTGGQTKAQQHKIGVVMHEFKEGDLYSSSGQKVKSPKQAIAIALSEAGVSKYAKGSRVPNKNKGGDCYYIAGTIALSETLPNIVTENKMPEFQGIPYVVHAEVSGQGAISGLRYGHAWVEDDLYVYDFSNGREIVFPKQIYYLLGNVKTTKPKYYKYTFQEAVEKMRLTGHYGSWDLKTESGL